MKKKKIIAVKKYTVEVNVLEGGRFTMNRTNEGFEVMELLGVLEHTKNDILQQIAGGIKPEIVKRKVIK